VKLESLIANTRTATLWVLLAGVLAPSLTSAQQAPPASEADGGGLSEVVVTASRQSESVNRVPLTIAAITQEALDERGILNAGDLTRVVPALTSDNSVTGRSTFSIRGISASTGAATTGVYLDDTPLTKRSTAGVNQNNGAPVPLLFDLQRVEVLKGPQGTLYGGSSQGGTVRFITPSPSLTEYSLSARAQLEDTEWGAPGYQYGAAVGGPIVQDKLGFRISAVKHYVGGWIDEYEPYSGTLLNDNSNNSSEWATRGSLLWSLNDAASFTLGFYHAQFQATDTGSSGLNGPIRPLPAGTTFTTPQVCFNRIPGRIGAPPTVPCPAGTPPPNIYVRPAMTSGPFDFLDGRDVGLNILNYNDAIPQDTTTKLDVPSLTFDYDVGGMQFKSITSYVHDDSLSNSSDRNQVGRALNTTAFPAATFYPFFPLYPNYLGITINTNVRNAISQELRLSQPPGSSSRFSWVAGLYYTRARSGVNYNIFTDYDPSLQALYGIDTQTFYGLPVEPDHRVGTLDTSIVDTEYAAFGEMNFNLTDKMKLIGGLRVSRVELDFFQLNYGITSGRTASDPYSTAVGSNKNTPVSPKAGFQYSFTEDDMLYATASKGFRAGGVNVPLNPTVCANGLAQFGLTVDDIPRSFGPDEVWSYELGTKLRLLDDRLQVNLAAFQINWNDVQATVNVQGCAQSWSQNGAKARSRGLDLQAQFRPIKPLTFDLAAAYTDARYVDAVTGPVPVSGTPPAIVISADSRFNLAPVQGNLGSQLDFHLGSLAAFLRADVQYSGGYLSGNDFGAANYSPYRDVPDWTRVDLRAGANFDWGSVQLYVYNATDDHKLRNARDSFGNVSDGRSGCTTAGGPYCTAFTNYSPFVTLNVQTPRVVGMQVNYRF
jgi:outer membrane receptor protein involved in Fe transport